MEAISAGGAQNAPTNALTVNVTETPRRPDDTATVNNRVNAVQTVEPTQASLDSTQQVPGPAQRSAPESGLEQQLRQSAVQANSERDNAADAGNSQTAVNAFRSVSQLSNGNTTAVSDSAGITATTEGSANTNRLSVEA